MRWLWAECVLPDTDQYEQIIAILRFTLTLPMCTETSKPKLFYMQFNMPKAAFQAVIFI